MGDLKTVSAGRPPGISLDSPLRFTGVLLSAAVVAGFAVAFLAMGRDRPGRSASPDEPVPVSRPTTRFIRDLAITADGKTLRCRFGYVQLLEWDLVQKRWRSATSLAPSADGEILAASISANGTIVAVGSADGSLAVCRDGRLCFSAANDAPVVAVACSADGRSVAWAAGTSLAIWNTRSEQYVTRQRDNTWDRPRIVFSGDGLWMFVAHENELVQVWDISTGAVVRAFRAPNLSVMAAAPDGGCLAVVDQFGNLGLWNAETGLLTAVPRQDGQCPMFALAFSPDGQRLACGRADGAVELWDIAACAMAEAWIGHAGGVCALRFTDRTDRLWTAGSDGTIRLWNLETLEEVAQIDVAGSSGPPRADRARRFPR